jgi:penicillin-binding protein 1A
MRQPGSAFKPFVYLAALENGFTPATLVLDGPFSIMDNGKLWSPKNYSNQYYGPSTLRMGLEKSRNLMTVRLANKVGMDKVSETAGRFGIDENMKKFLSFSLGAGETTLMRLSSAYAMLANGGQKVEPTFIDRIQDREGRTIFSYDTRPCVNCGDLLRWDAQAAPAIQDTRPQIADEKNVYQLVSMMEGVVQRGTATRLARLNRPLAGKTGTTNESKDTWFIGFTPDLVVGVFVGFDDPKSLGKRETGSSVAAPIFGDFIEEALAQTPATPFRKPQGLKNMRVNRQTGRIAQAGDPNAIWEAFIPGTEPVEDFSTGLAVLDGDESANYPGSYVDYWESPVPVYQDSNVEIYDPSQNQYESGYGRYRSNNEDAMTTFSRQREERQRMRDPGQTGQRQERVYVPSGQPQNQQRRPSDRAPVEDPNLSGTGGLY